jgi:hypothetical protein
MRTGCQTHFADRFVQAAHKPIRGLDAQGDIWPHRAADQVTGVQMARRSARAQIIGALALCAGVGGCLALLPDPPPKTAVQVEAERLQMAMIRCENQLRDQLADPDGLEPEPHGAWRVEAASQDDLTFRFKARARNAVGALVWADFECRAQRDGSAWSAEVRQV